MKKWIIVLAVASLAAGPVLAQAKGGTTKPSEAPKTTAPATPAAVTPPAVTEPVRSVSSAAGQPHEGTVGAQLALGTNWQSQAPSVGLSYYLGRDLEIQTLTTVSLSGSTDKDNLNSSSTDDSASSLTIIAAGLFESRVAPQIAWSWGPVAGFQIAGSEAKAGGVKRNKGSFDLVAGAGVQFKYFVFPQVAFFANFQGLVDWTASNTDVRTQANGTKDIDTSVSGFSLSTSTSNIGIAVYLN